MLFYPHFLPLPVVKRDRRSTHSNATTMHGLLKMENRKDHKCRKHTFCLRVDKADNCGVERKCQDLGHKKEEEGTCLVCPRVVAITAGHVVGMFYQPNVALGVSLLSIVALRVWCSYCTFMG